MVAPCAGGTDEKSHLAIAAEKLGIMQRQIQMKRASNLNLGRRIQWAGLLAIGAIACSGHGEEEGTASDAIIGGAGEAGYASVGYMYYADGDKAPVDQRGQYVSCSGTLIAPDVVLTAAHCLRGITEFGLGEVRDKKRYKIRTKYSHPHFRWTSEGVSNDIGVVKLEKPVPNATLAKLGKAKTGPGVRSIGYGRTLEGGATTFDPSMGTRKSIPLSVDKIEDGVVVAKRKGVGNCYGDSGGPLMIEGRNEVVGVLSSIENAPCGAGDWSAFSDVDTFKGFIDDAMACNTPASGAGLPATCAKATKVSGTAWSLDMEGAIESLHVNPYDGSILADVQVLTDPSGARFSIESLDATGTRNWNYRTPEWQARILGISSKGTTYVLPAGVDTLRAIGRDGQVLWERKDKERSIYYQTKDGRAFLVEYTDSNERVSLAQINESTGGETWRRSIDPSIPGLSGTMMGTVDGAIAPVVFGAGGHTYVLAEVAEETLYGTESKVRLVGHSKDGTRTSTFRVDAPLHATPVVLSDGSVISLSTRSGLSLTKANGGEKWRTTVSAKSSWAPAVRYPTLVLSPDENTVYLTGTLEFSAIDVATGKLKWRKSWGVVGSNAMFAFGPKGVFYVLGSDGALRSLSSDGTEQWSDPSTNTGSVFATDAAGAVYVRRGSTLSKIVRP